MLKKVSATTLPFSNTKIEMVKHSIEQTLQERVNESLDQFITVQHGTSRLDVLPAEDDLPQISRAEYDPQRDVIRVVFSEEPYNSVEVNDTLTVLQSEDGKTIIGFEIRKVRENRGRFAPTLTQRLRHSTNEYVHSLSDAVRENIKVNLAQDLLRVRHESSNVSEEEHRRRIEERVARVRELNLRLRSDRDISNLEREPAYIRKNIPLEQGPSGDAHVIRYTLSEEIDVDGNRRIELKRGNAHLHESTD